MNQSKVFRVFDDYSVKFKMGNLMDKSGFALAVEEVERDSDSSTLGRVQREYSEVENILSGGFERTRHRIATQNLISSAHYFAETLPFGTKTIVSDNPAVIAKPKIELGEAILNLIIIANQLGIKLEDALIETWHLRKQILNDEYERSDREAGSK